MTGPLHQNVNAVLAAMFFISSFVGHIGKVSLRYISSGF